MAIAAVLPFRPTPARSAIINASSAAADRTRKSSSSPNWWSPVFGFSSDPDYLNQEGKQTRSERTGRFEPGKFTEEKARQLRRMSGGTSSFHDSMYHSAVASRMASDFSNRTADDVEQ